MRLKSWWLMLSSTLSNIFTCTPECFTVMIKYNAIIALRIDFKN